MNAAALHADALVWDQHGCLPLRPDATIDELARYAGAGVDCVSINVGFDATPWHQAVQVLARFRHQVLAEPERFVLVGTADDVLAARRTGRLAVAFDLEGAEALDGQLAMVQTYYELGVRTMLIAYNEANRAGGGCHDDPAIGLTAFGRDVVAEMNRVGMLVDATHCSRRTTMELCEASAAPVILSHSAPLGVARHERNVADEQLRACAATGGVIGINGIGLFLGDADAGTAALFRAIDYAVDLVGPDHVGLGLDYVFDRAELEAFLRADPERFPARGGYSAALAFVAPEQLPELTELMVDAGYAERDVRAILGESFLRVASAVWK